MTRAGLILAISLSAVLAGCAESRSTACAPTLDECFVGHPFAECGRLDPPRYACPEGEGRWCRWFVGGCVPEGHVVSTCPPEDQFCHDVPESLASDCSVPAWPFTPEQTERVDARRACRVADFYGVEPWDRQRKANLTLQVGARHGEADPSALCDDGACRELRRLESYLFDTVVVLFSAASDTPGGAEPYLVIELIPTDGGFRARGCSDSLGPTLLCATRGGVVINDFPEKEDDFDTLEGRFEARFIVDGEPRDFRGEFPFEL